MGLIVMTRKKRNEVIVQQITKQDSSRKQLQVWQPLVTNFLARWVWEFVYIGANWNDKKEKERGHCSKDYQTEQ